MFHHSTYAKFIELTATRELYSYCFEVYRNNEVYEIFRNNDNPTKRLSITDTLPNGHLYIYEILTPPLYESKKPVKIRCVRYRHANNN